MNLLKQPMIVVLMIAVIAIVAVILGQAYKLAWVSDWLAPMLMLLFFIALCTLTRAAPNGITTRKGRVVWWARTAVIAGLIWLYGSIDLVGDAPVTLRLMGVSWTMSPYAAARMFQLGGLVLGMIACGMSWMDHRREAAAAARANSASEQAPPATTAAGHP